MIRIESINMLPFGVRDEDTVIMVYKKYNDR